MDGMTTRPEIEVGLAVQPGSSLGSRCRGRPGIGPAAPRRRGSDPAGTDRLCPQRPARSPRRCRGSASPLMKMRPVTSEDATRDVRRPLAPLDIAAAHLSHPRHDRVTAQISVSSASSSGTNRTDWIDLPCHGRASDRRRVQRCGCDQIQPALSAGFSVHATLSIGSALSSSHCQRLTSG